MEGSAKKKDFGVPGMRRNDPGNVLKKGGKFKFSTIQCIGVMGMVKVEFGIAGMLKMDYGI